MAESPPCATVLMVLRTLNVSVELISVDLSKGEQFSTEFTALNPLHTVPALVLDDGAVLLESRAIITYLVDQFANETHQTLYPKDTIQRALVNQLLYFDATRLYPSQTSFLGPLLHRQLADKDGESKFRSNLDYLDQLLSKKQFVAGSSISLADISILGSLMFSCAARFDFSQWPNIDSWMTRMRALQPYDEVIAKPLIRFTGYLDSLKH
jgi:glutathione S-transferase